MGRLTNLKPAVPTLKGAVAYAPDDRKERDRFRDQQHWRKWYRTARWKKLRWATLLRDKFTCQRCGRLEGNTGKLVCDHIKPHRGDERLFWDGPFTTLCASCHSSAKQSEEHAAARSGIGPLG